MWRSACTTRIQEVAGRERGWLWVDDIFIPRWRCCQFFLAMDQIHADLRRFSSLFLKLGFRSTSVHPGNTNLLDLELIYSHVIFTKCWKHGWQASVGGRFHIQSLEEANASTVFCLLSSDVPNFYYVWLSLGPLQKKKKKSHLIFPTPWNMLLR